MKLFFNGKMGGVLGKKMREKDWTVLWVGGMWFQDLWTYDFRRTEMCVIPYATQEGEISFCAYNTGVGWRQIVENMHTVAKTKDWFTTRGRHQIYAGDRPMQIDGRRKLPVAGSRAEGPARARTSPAATDEERDGAGASRPRRVATRCASSASFWGCSSASPPRPSARPGGWVRVERSSPRIYAACRLGSSSCAWAPRSSSSGLQTLRWHSSCVRRSGFAIDRRWRRKS